jgi:hypothetical protein
MCRLGVCDEGYSCRAGQRSARQFMTDTVDKVTDEKRAGLCGAFDILPIGRVCLTSVPTLDELLLTQRSAPAHREAAGKAGWRAS